MRLRTKERKLVRRKLVRQLKDAPYPMHGRSLGYCGSPREPYTWFVCNNGHREMGTPWEVPGQECSRCGWDQLEFLGWEIAGSAAAFAATMDAVGPNDDGRAAERYARTQDPRMRLRTVNRPMFKRWARYKVRSKRYGWCFAWGDTPEQALEIIDGYQGKEAERSDSLTPCYPPTNPLYLAAGQRL